MFQNRRRFWHRLIVMAICSLVLVLFGTTVHAQDAVSADDVAAIQVSIDATWVLVTAMLVFFMQTGFALLEAGMIRHTGVVNSLMENFMDAALGGIAFWRLSGWVTDRRVVSASGRSSDMTP